MVVRLPSSTICDVHHPEVDELDVPVAQVDDVVRLEVAVRPAPAVQLTQRRDERGGVDSLMPRKREILAVRQVRVRTAEQSSAVAIRTGFHA